MPNLLLPIISGISNVMRLPALAAFLGTLLAQSVGFFAQWFTAKTAIQLGIVTAVVSLTAGVFVAIKSLIAGISVSFPPFFNHAMSLIIPDNFSLCLSSIVSAHVIKWVWSWQVHFIEMYASSR